MAAHTSTQRQFIVRKLAEFFTPNEIIGQFRANWPDTDCDESDVDRCNPRVVVTSPDEFDLFNKTRADRKAENERLWPGMPETLQEVLLGLKRDYQTQRNRNAFDMANKTAAEIAKIEGGFYAGKATKEAPSAVGGDRIEAITRTIVDPKDPEAV
jgi:hypothetical protein